jgi:hypothetical protein
MKHNKHFLKLLRTLLFHQDITQTQQEAAILKQLQETGPQFAVLHKTLKMTWIGWLAAEFLPKHGV